MTIIGMGISHHTAPVALREMLQSGPEALAAVLARDASLAATVTEWAVVSTCNRFELYASVDGGGGIDALYAWLAAASGATEFHVYRANWRHWIDAAAVEQLSRVAGGLESQVLGEPQILGQVANALEIARERGTVGPYIDALFRAAQRAGKRARSETGIGRRPSSISAVAVNQIARRHGDLTRVNIAIIGAGTMANLAVEALRKRGVAHLTVVNRTTSRAQALVGEAGTALGMAALPAVLGSADVLICATGAPEPILTAAMVRSARGGRPLTVVDLAVPRDVAADVADLPGVTVVNMDRLHDRLDAARQARLAEVPAVEAIIAAEVAAWERTARELQVRPLIRALRTQAESIRRQEVERLLGRVGDDDPALTHQVTLFSRALVNQLLHEPTVRLRNEAAHGSAEPLASAVSSLFNLPLK